MNRNALVLEYASADIETESSDAPAPAGTQAKNDDAARSEENILQWMSYLPEDCIRTMIEMGWDITT